MNVPGSGDTWPEGRSRDPVPGLPPEWGDIVIPDDPAELAEEAEAVRRELGLSAHPDVWAAPTSQRAAATFAALRPVVLTMSLAVLTMLVSLLAVAWPGALRQPVAQRPAAGGSAGATGGSTSRSLPALDLVDERGEPVSLRALLPAVIVVLDGCTCTAQIRTVAAVTPAKVTVAAVTTGRTVPQRLPMLRVRALADPASELRNLLATGSNGGAQALLVAQSGTIVRTLTNLDDPDLYRNDVAELAAS
jgi:hypothetical protein